MNMAKVILGTPSIIINEIAEITVTGQLANGKMVPWNLIPVGLYGHQDLTSNLEFPVRSALLNVSWENERFTEESLAVGNATDVKSMNTCMQIKQLV